MHSLVIHKFIQFIQLKDFLTLYNKVTELCFNRCVDNFNERDLAKHEVGCLLYSTIQNLHILPLVITLQETCVSHCVNKFALFNQNMMKVYVEVQSEINQKRMQELEEGQKLIQENQQQQLSNTSNTTAANITASLSSPSSQLPA